MPNRPDTESTESSLLRPAEAMARLRVSRQTLTRYVDRGQLAVVVLPSGHRRYPEADVDRVATNGPAAAAP